MFRRYLILAAFVIAMASTDATYAQCPDGVSCNRPVRSLLEAAPVRKAVAATAKAAVKIPARAIKRTAHVAGRVARASIAAPARVVKRTAGFFRDRRPARRAIGAVGRGLLRPLARARFCCQ
jgi:hypothetical protein